MGKLAITGAAKAAIQAIPTVTAYCAAKGAVAALTRAVAVHCRQSGYPNPLQCHPAHGAPRPVPRVRRIAADERAIAGAGRDRLDHLFPGVTAARP